MCCSRVALCCLLSCIVGCELFVGCLFVGCPLCVAWGCSLRVAGCLLRVGRGSSVAGCWLLVVSCWLLVVG